MNLKTTILSTKILSEIQKKELSNYNYQIIDYDFISVNKTAFDFPKIENKIIIFTSQNAVLSVLENKNIDNFKKNIVFCVGLKTKALLEENGFKVEVYVDYAADLAEIITLIYNEEQFVFFSGNLRKETLPKALKAAKIKFQEIEVYETILTPQVIKNQLDGILFFSPSGVESYLQKNKIKNEICFCIGNSTAESLEKYTNKIIVAEYPSIESVIEEVITEFN
jgi:uroporphyrinogen-III synthase